MKFTVRKLAVAAAVAGTLAVLPLSMIANDSQMAGGQGPWPQKHTVQLAGQGSWPLKNVVQPDGQGSWPLGK